MNRKVCFPSKAERLYVKKRTGYIVLAIILPHLSLNIAKKSVFFGILIAG